jgi:hypothetical protein
MARQVAVFALLFSAVACGNGNSSTSCPTGTERCACYRNQTCNAGLTCFSAVCVQDTRGVDGATPDTTAGTGGSPARDFGSVDVALVSSGTGGSVGSGGLDASASPFGGAPGAGGIRALDANRGAGGVRGTGGAASVGIDAGNGGSNGSGGEGQGGLAVDARVGAGGAFDGGPRDLGQGGAPGTGGSGGQCGGAGGTYLLHDGFECGTTQWRPQPSTAFVVALDGTNTYQVTDASTAFSSFSYATAGSATWSNVRIEARVKAISFTKADSTSYVSVYGRFGDAQNYYAIQWLGNGDVSVSYRQNGSGSDAYDPDPVLTTGQWYTFRIDLSGTDMATYVDGQLIQRVGLSSVTSGSIAIGTRNAVARFDDVKVTQL